MRSTGGISMMRCDQYDSLCRFRTPCGDFYSGFIRCPVNSPTMVVNDYSVTQGQGPSAVRGGRHVSEALAGFFWLPPVGMVTFYEFSESSSGHQLHSGLHELVASSLNPLSRRALQRKDSPEFLVSIEIQYNICRASLQAEAAQRS